MRRTLVITVRPGGCCTTNVPPDCDGYPVVRVRGRLVGLHRLMLGAALDKDLTGLVARHACDNPACVNPNHLVPGTHADNVADRVARGRSARGERHGRAKLTAEIVRAIRASDEPHAALARRHDVDPKLIRRVRNFEIWADVGPAAPQATEAA